MLTGRQKRELCEFFHGSREVNLKIAELFRLQVFFDIHFVRQPARPHDECRCVSPRGSSP